MIKLVTMAVFQCYGMIVSTLASQLLSHGWRLTRTTTVNVASEQKDPNSVLNYYKTLIKLRKDPKYIEAFTYGEFVALEDPNDHTIAYLRKGKEHTLMVVANFGAAPVKFDVNENSQILLSSDKATIENKQVIVPEGTAVIVLL